MLHFHKGLQNPGIHVLFCWTYKAQGCTKWFPDNPGARALRITALKVEPEAHKFTEPWQEVDHQYGWGGANQSPWPPKKCQKPPMKHEKPCSVTQRPSADNPPLMSPAPQTRTLWLQESDARRKYWIIRLRKIAKAVRSSCVLCGNCAENPSIIFTCTTTGAVHLTLVTDKSSEAFLKLVWLWLKHRWSTGIPERGHAGLGNSQDTKCHFRRICLRFRVALEHSSCKPPECGCRVTYQTRKTSSQQCVQEPSVYWRTMEDISNWNYPHGQQPAPLSKSIQVPRTSGKNFPLRPMISWLDDTTLLPSLSWKPESVRNIWWEVSKTE